MFSRVDDFATGKLTGHGRGIKRFW